MSGYETLSANSQNIKKFQLHQKARSFLVIVVVGVPVFLAMLAYLFYQDATKQNNAINSPSAHEESIPSPEAIPTDTLTPNQSIDESTTPTYSDPATTSPQAPPSHAPAPTTGGIPAGVQSALNSIEANGIKGSPYVASNLDTSNIPVGTSITFDRNSWTQHSETAGSINATISILGQSRSGSVVFGVTEGAWRATGYSLN